MNATYPALDVSPAYQSAAEELTDQLWRLQLLLERAVARLRERFAPDQQRGLGSVAIFDDEIDALLGAVPQWHDAAGTDAIATARARCVMRAQTSVAEGFAFPLDTIRRRFDLDDLEFDAFLLCLAAELHPSYGRVYAYLNNDVTRARPSVALLVDILSESWSQRLATRRALARTSTLFRLHLLESRPASDDVSAEISVDPGVVAFALDDTAPYEAEPLLETLALDELLLSPGERVSFEALARSLIQNAIDTSKPTIAVISGAPSSGRRTLARAICREIGRCLRVMGEAVTPQEPSDLARAVRDAHLRQQIPAIRLATGDEQIDLRAVVRALQRLPVQLAFLIVDSDAPPRLHRDGYAHILSAHLGTPPASVRTSGWKRALREEGATASDDTIQTLAAVYPFSVARIYASVRDACLQFAEDGAKTLGIRELAAAARNQTSHHLDTLAQALPPRYGWNDIVLPDDERARLREIADAVRNRERVMEQWGFGEKVCTGPGVNAIFFGPSGTGKTMAASILAAELGMAIYRVDLSRVVSKYIGDTERNLNALFDEARRSFAMLFFDEAEAIFGKRSEVKDAHDRYANIEVAYLLQRMETFEGVAILATNLRKHMDNAFLRRLQFAVEFPLPGYEQRLQIWRQVWPASAELADDIDLEYIANRFELSGGHIRNVAMMAAYLACEEHRPIGMSHLVAATKREFQKLGRGMRVDD